MNKDRAIEQLKFLRANIDESLQDLKEFKEFHEEKNECVSENHKQRIKECEEDIQALDIAIDSLQPKVIKYDDLSLFDKLYEFMCDHALAIAPDERHSGEERLIKQTQYDLLQDLIDLMQRMKAEDKADKE